MMQGVATLKLKSNLNFLSNLHTKIKNKYFGYEPNLFTTKIVWKIAPNNI